MARPADIGDLLYEGKAKRIHATSREGVVAVEFKDAATAFNARRRAELQGKGRLNCLIAAHLFEALEQAGIPTHYLGLLNDNWMAARAVEIIPIEVVIRNRAAGSICKQLPIAPATLIDPPLLDLYYKDDALDDPLLSDARLTMLGIVSEVQRHAIECLARRVNDRLRQTFARARLDLVDFKIELGLTPQGQLVVADEISPDSCRLWKLDPDSDANDRILDKDRFRRNLGNVIKAYGEVLKRVQELGLHPTPYR